MNRKVKLLIQIFAAFLIGFTCLCPTVFAEDGESQDETKVSDNKEDSLSDKQLNSIAMLNYLTVLNQEINASKNSRLFLEEAYDSLISNTFPSAIDNRTQIQLDYMLDTIEDYRMIDVKRERLQYIYDQNKAQALRSAIPNPVGLLSATMSFDWKRVIASVVYMAIDSKASYDSAMAQADMQYLQDNWALDDAASAALHQSRKQLFDYMVDIVQENNLPGDYTLSEKSVNDFVEYRNETNPTLRIQSLESNKAKYEHFGGYWILLAQSYYENENYTKCLEAVDKYVTVQTRIFRKDHDYANVLPLAIYSAKETIKNKNTLEKTVRGYLEDLVNNIDTDDWALRYFAAQTYVYLYSVNNDKDDLRKAYDLVLNNVTYLIKEQKSMNTAYMQDVKKVDVPKDATKEEKKDINNYNKLLQEARKIELPPVYEPLYLNCDLLFSLADILNLSSVEKSKVDKILHGAKGEALFLDAILDNCYWFNKTNEVEIDYVCTLDTESLTVPANLVSNATTIKIVIHSADGTTSTFEDWTVKKVDRKKKVSIQDFEVEFVSSTYKKYKFKNNDVVEVIIDSVPGSNAEPFTIKYNVAVTKKLKVLDDIKFYLVK